MPAIPVFLPFAFVLTTFATLILFFIALKNRKGETKNTFTITVGLGLWLGLQAILTQTGVYLPNAKAFPPKLMLLGILPMMVIIFSLLLLPKGRAFMDSFRLKDLVLISAVRILVEIVLLELFFYNAIPKIMTFEGWNFDILAGISALFVYYFGFIQKRISYRMMLVWNIVALGLLVTIVLIAALSMPSPIQSFGFTQPNIAIFFFPYVWLPSFVVPVVLFSHIVSIRQILTQLQK